MKKILLVLVSLLLTSNLYAELPPYVYENLQKNAPEALTITVTKVQTSLSSLTEKKVTVEARVLRVKHSRSGLKKGDSLTIVYYSVFWRPSGWVGPSSLPVLEEKHMYQAFLRKDERTNYYYPDARGKSFK